MLHYFHVLPNFCCFFQLPFTIAVHSSPGTLRPTLILPLEMHIHIHFVSFFILVVYANHKNIFSTKIKKHKLFFTTDNHYSQHIFAQRVFTAQLASYFARDIEEVPLLRCQQVTHGKWMQLYTQCLINRLHPLLK